MGDYRIYKKKKKTLHSLSYYLCGLQNNNLADLGNCFSAFRLVSLGNELLQLTWEVDRCSLASNYTDETDFQVIGVRIFRNRIRFYGEEPLVPRPIP